MIPVLIVGAGPVGLTVALCLAHARIAVDLYESTGAIAGDIRASTFHPPTLDLLDAFGLGRALVAKGLITPRWQVRLHETHERAEFDLAVLSGETGYPYRLQCEQQKLQQLLLERLASFPHVRVHWNCSVEDAGEQRDGVWVRAAGQIRRGSFLIGTDGAHSTVRRCAGIEFGGESYPETTLLVTTDFDFAQALPGLSGVNYVWSDYGTFSLLRLPEVWRVSLYPDLGETVNQALTDEALEMKLQRIASRPARYRVLDRRSYRIHQRVANTYRRGRILLAGDAAHLNSPSGGMGMNGGIHDAFNLADKVIRVCRGENSELLDQYVRQRRPIAIEHIIAQADRNRRRMRERDPARRQLLLRELQEIAADPMRARTYLLESAMITGLRRAAATD